MLLLSKLNYRGDWYLLRAKFTSDWNFFVREVWRGRPSGMEERSLEIGEVLRGGRRWWRQEAGLHIFWKKVFSSRRNVDNDSAVTFKLTMFNNHHNYFHGATMSWLQRRRCQVAALQKRHNKSVTKSEICHLREIRRCQQRLHSFIHS